MDIDTPRVARGLAGLSETMLWSVHDRAREASRHDAILDDPRTISITPPPTMIFIIISAR